MKSFEDPLDAIERVRTLLVTGKLDVLPDLLVCRPRGLLQPALEARHLARDARAAKQAEALQAAWKPVAQMDLVVTGHRRYANLAFFEKSRRTRPT